MSEQPSLVRGADQPPLLEITIGEALTQAASRWGGETALVSAHQGVRWTFGELARRADALAAGLLARGRAKGDRIGIWSPNCAEWTLTQFGAARIGLVLATTNPACRRARPFPTATSSTTATSSAGRSG